MPKLLLLDRTVIIVGLPSRRGLFTFFVLLLLDRTVIISYITWPVLSVPVSGTLLLLFMRPAVVRLGHVCLAHVVRHLVFPSWIVVGRVCH